MKCYIHKSAHLSDFMMYEKFTRFLNMVRSATVFVVFAVFPLAARSAKLRNGMLPSFHSVFQQFVDFLVFNLNYRFSSRGNQFQALLFI